MFSLNPLWTFLRKKRENWKIPYLINNRWGLWGQSRWLAYWLVSAAWRSIWTYPSWGPSFVIFFVVDSPYCSFYILNPHKTLMQGQIVSHGVLEQTKVQSKEWGSTINSFSKIIWKLLIKLNPSGAMFFYFHEITVLSVHRKIAFFKRALDKVKKADIHLSHT